ncbi:mitochondrial 37S ribosomal protein mS29 [Kwoniella dejecticola CBS 10117]|uniref:Small ribosomal subunit protein mS29 n=1 Tax=Kwoniella dejecticola CBS 10117 TaxID=1296121 RepID=A0A1A6AE09_9TREE|nr:uncharacterized protein I303_00117 [Kwoniella dejecticola CBS 10117]OBR88306.1 hypothetical protein I303_00117 [Kwoniella dejecticola CBS 10117]
MRPIIRFSSTPLSRGISTSAPVSAVAKPKKAGATSKNAKQGFNQKKKEVSPGGSGGSGQSTVALKFSMAGQPPDLSDLPRLQPGNFKSDNVGKPTTFPKATFDKLRAFSLSKKVEQELSSNGGPASVIRQSTIDLARQLDANKGKSSKDSRYVLTGERGSGKSMLLLQTVAYAMESGWIVLFNPKATEWTNSSSHFIYDPLTQLFSQWQSAQKILSTLLAVNKDNLDAIKLTSDIELAQGKTATKGSKLSELVANGSKDDRIAVKALDSVMAVLEKQTQFPVLWAIDETQTLFTTSQYRTPEYQPIEPYHLSTPRLALDFISGRRSFAKGTVLSALSLSDPKNPLSPSLISGLKLATSQPITPYTQLDPYHSLHASSGLKKREIPFNMSDKEVSGLYELLVRKGKTSANRSDNLYMELKSLSGGNPNEIKRGLSRLTAAITV